MKMDLETARELGQTIIWSKVQGELRDRINSLTMKLRKCTPDQLQEIQIKIGTLEEVIRLADDVKDRESGT